MNWFRLTIFAILMISCTACINIGAKQSEAEANANVKIDFPPTADIKTVKQADAVLAAVELSRSQVEWRYNQQEQICYTKFFVNSCLLDAKRLYRHDLTIIKSSEVAANYFKRKHAVEERDKALAERNISVPQAEPDPKLNGDIP